MFESSRGLADRWNERLREQLAASQAQYLSHPSEETMAEYQRALRAYADLVLRGKLPQETAPTR